MPAAINPDSRVRLTPDNVAVVIPALNEALRIRGVVTDALAHCPHVIVVDDGSDDGTAQAIADLPVTVLRHPRRMGKGASLRDGFAEALRRGFAGVLTMDGDGQHAASDIPRLLDAGNRYPAHIVIGARLRKRALQPTYRRLANHFGDWGIAWGTGYQIADTQSGQRLYPAAVAALDDVPGEDFVFEAQILISAAQQLGTRCVSVPIESRYQCVDSDEQFRASHFKPWRDFSRITSHIVGQCLRRGGLVDVYRSIRAHPPLIDDPSGEFAAAPPSHPHTKAP
ncbi:glycosyltransferase family 2 protein [Lysobacter koreensis]|uniref:Glycosyltransferase family 2 protein n=1 Tax=Lysobacter koreensis TaxID=266122 RepID=A0ABW2YK10_9GAMM